MIETRNLECELRQLNGMTLIEVVIAVFIFGIVIGGACRLVVQTRQSMDNARSHYIAVNIAKNRLEKGRTFGFDQLAVFSEDDIVIDSSGAADSGGDYRRTTVVLDATSNLVEMIVTVEIRDKITRQFSSRKSETVRTYFSDY
jgi:prepilin-type N-terminal cleavage/methylation domain-containing protein